MLGFAVALLHLHGNYRLDDNISCKSNTGSLLDYFSYNHCKSDFNIPLLPFAKRIILFIGYI